MGRNYVLGGALLLAFLAETAWSSDLLLYFAGPDTLGAPVGARPVLSEYIVLVNTGAEAVDLCGFEVAFETSGASLHAVVTSGDRRLGASRDFTYTVAPFRGGRGALVGATTRSRPCRQLLPGSEIALLRLDLSAGVTGEVQYVELRFVEGKDPALPPDRLPNRVETPGRTLLPALESKDVAVLPGRPFIRGDADGDGRNGLPDVVRVLRSLFGGEDDLTCLDAADANDDGRVDITDAIFNLQGLFIERFAPWAPPYPLCGSDPSPDGLSCEAFGACDSEVFGKAVTLEWAPPRENADGTPLTDLAGYRLYFGPASRAYTRAIDVGNSTVFSLYFLPGGDLFFAVTAYDFSGNESGFSEELWVPASAFEP